MKVLHLATNTASQMQVSVDSLRKRGVNARGIITSSSVIHTNDGLEVIYPPIEGLRRYSFPWLRRHLVAVSNVLQAIWWADVVHYHYGGNWALPHEIDRLLVRGLKKVRLVTFWGEIRISEVEAADNPYFRRYLVERGERDPHRTGKSLRESRSLQAKYANDGYTCVLGGETLVPHVQQDLVGDPPIIRCMIDTTRVHPAYPDPNSPRPVVVHTPSSREIKGTNAVLAAVETLRRRGLDFRFHLVENTPREEALKLLQGADVYLDQFVISGYGAAAIEAMAFGKPVVCYMAPSVAEKYPPTLPIVNAGQDDLVATLEGLLRDGTLRRELGERSRVFATTYHDALQNAGQLVELYNELLERRMQHSAPRGSVGHT
jgi:glycosyltransferase involved in cell wall biosynthesis